MREQLADGDVLLPILGKFRKIRGNGIIEPNLSKLEQTQHRRSCRYDLCQRSYVKNGVDSHTLAGGLERAHSICLLVYDLAMMTNQDHSARALLILNRILDDVVENLELRGCRRLSTGSLCSGLRQRGFARM